MQPFGYVERRWRTALLFQTQPRQRLQLDYRRTQDDMTASSTPLVGPAANCNASKTRAGGTGNGSWAAAIVGTPQPSDRRRGPCHSTGPARNRRGRRGRRGRRARPFSPELRADIEPDAVAKPQAND